jgi:L-ascorbate metabolism protein UlaG (beta-lactamase superfamily)
MIRGLLMAAAVALLYLGAALGGSGYSGPVSDHFDGRRFHMAIPRDRHLTDYLQWLAQRDPGAWDDWTEQPPGAPPPQRVPGAALLVTPVNHATVLIQTAGLNILTDPIWSHRASPFSFTGPDRRAPPGIRFDDLPPIDAVLISHSHYDHMDLPTLRRLWERDRPRIFVGLGNRGTLAAAGIGGVVETDWWQAHALAPGVRVHGVPAQHWTSRGLFDRNRTLWLGYVVEAPGGDVFFAGDTGLGPHFAAIAARFPRVRLALLPIGAYLPRWFMKPVHMSPGDAVTAWRTLGAEHALGIHYGTFRLAEEGQRQPVDDLAAALSAPHVPSALAGRADLKQRPARFDGDAEPAADCFRTPPFGQGWRVPDRCERVMLATSTAPVTRAGFADP